MILRNRSIGQTTDVVVAVQAQQCLGLKHGLNQTLPTA